ncbi:MAG TPA: right-handed parallel beta-helix repeat-containing protein, partial [Pyrinomonadaceae bacterium]|nr:right-handed parallel beta-helix repeat-containing protein [Pyrinomonadaceae bacterium]
ADTCENISDRLQDDFSKKGKLKVSLEPDLIGGGDCPTVAGGGYVGFEHNLYRVEIADVDTGPPQFKWSQYGGGLVGRGRFDAVPQTVTIKANLQAITNSGLSSFYLEALEFDKDLGHWRVTYGAKATLNNDVLTLGSKIFGTIPANPQPTDTTFFRLWNDIALVTDFANKEIPNDLGIILEFDAPAGANYVPGDFWTFAVRAGEIFNPQILIDHKAPEGIHYHRVPLAVLDWTSNTTVADPIEDCRHLFQPLTRLATCCSFRVGDGMSSWGDFDKIQDAIDALPAAGGEVCVLPGEYKENVTITGRRNITVKGCGKRSRLVAVKDEPAILIKDSQIIKIESLAIFATQKGPGVSLEGEEMKGEEGGATRDITLEKLYIEAAQRSAIEAMFAIDVKIRGCDIKMSDEPSDAPGIFFTGDDSWIEHNIVRVISARFKNVELSGETLDTEAFLTASAGRGGIQIGGTSDRVRIFDNLIQGGQGNGITLGSLAEVGQDRPIKIYIPGTKGILDPCDPCKDVDTSKPPGISVDPGVEIVSAGALNEIYIERNLIYNMGSNGIGVASFWDLREKDEFITVDRLTIVDNEIRRCMLRNIADIPDNMLNSVGYGGIALADVDYLVIRDNVIENNGPSQLFPICGIFVLHGDGIEISRNRILNNGADRGDASAKNAHPGARGGIYIVFAVAPRVPVEPKSQGKTVPAPVGPAAKIHDNIVSSPLGQALILAALGPVSVLGNQLTTHGVIRRQDSSTFWASTVLILNLGLSNELYFQMLGFVAVMLGQVKAKDTYTIEGDTLVSPKPGLDDESLGQYLANGNVLFANNQCVLDLMDDIQDLAISSIMIASLDDVGFHNNQCDCDLPPGDLIFSQVVLFGMSLRVTDNRFKEGLLGAWLSAMTLGLLNMTTNNQATHCLWIRGNMVENQPNTILASAFNPKICDPFERVLPAAGKGK